METSQVTDFLDELTQENFTNAPKSIPTRLALWVIRRLPLSLEEIEECQRTSGALRRLATVSRPHICARLARLAARVESSQETDIYRINDLAKTGKYRQLATDSEYAAAFRPITPTRGDVEGRTKARGKAMILVAR